MSVACGYFIEHTEYYFGK